MFPGFDSSFRTNFIFLAFRITNLLDILFCTIFIVCAVAVLAEFVSHVMPQQEFSSSSISFSLFNVLLGCALQGYHSQM